MLISAASTPIDTKVRNKLEEHGGIGDYIGKPTWITLNWREELLCRATPLSTLKPDTTAGQPCGYPRRPGGRRRHLHRRERRGAGRQTAEEARVMRGRA